MNRGQSKGHLPNSLKYGLFPRKTRREESDGQPRPSVKQVKVASGAPIRKVFGAHKQIEPEPESCKGGKEDRGPRVSVLQVFTESLRKYKNVFENNKENPSKLTGDQSAALKIDSGRQGKTRGSASQSARLRSTSQLKRSRLDEEKPLISSDLGNRGIRRTEREQHGLSSLAEPVESKNLQVPAKGRGRKVAHEQVQRRGASSRLHGRGTEFAQAGQTLSRELSREELTHTGVKAPPVTGLKPNARVASLAQSTSSAVSAASSSSAMRIFQPNNSVRSLSATSTFSDLIPKHFSRLASAKVDLPWRGDKSNNDKSQQVIDESDMEQASVRGNFGESRNEAPLRFGREWRQPKSVTMCATDAKCARIASSAAIDMIDMRCLGFGVETTSNFTEEPSAHKQRAPIESRTDWKKNVYGLTPILKQKRPQSKDAANSLNFTREVLEKQDLNQRDHTANSSRLNGRQATPYIGRSHSIVQEESGSHDFTNPEKTQAVSAAMVPVLRFPTELVQQSQKFNGDNQSSDFSSMQMHHNTRVNTIEDEGTGSRGLPSEHPADASKKPVKSALKKKSSFHRSNSGEQQNHTMKKLRITDEPPQVIEAPTTETTLSDYAEHIRAVVDSKKSFGAESMVDWSGLSQALKGDLAERYCPTKPKFDSIEKKAEASEDLNGTARNATPKFHRLVMDDFFHQKYNSRTAVTPVKIFDQTDIPKVKDGRNLLIVEVRRLQKSLGDDLVVIPYCEELAQRAQELKSQSQTFKEE